MNSFFKFVPEAVGTVRVDGKKAIFDALALRFSAAYGLEYEPVLEALEEREALGSTGFGRGVAIPHARMDGLRQPIVSLIRLDTPVDYASADGMPVDIVFGLLSPANAGASHLHALAAISRMVRDEAIHRALADASDSESLYALLTNATDRDAA